MTRSNRVHISWLRHGISMLTALLFLISCGKPSSLFPAKNDLSFQWEVRSFDEALFGGDSLDMKTLERDFSPFLQSYPLPNYWRQERENQLLLNHYSNVQNLIDKNSVAFELNEISGRAKELLKLPRPDILYFYIDRFDLEDPCLYYAGRTEEEPTYAFVGLHNFLGEGYPGYEGIPAYQRALLRGSQIPVAYAHAVLKSLRFENPQDATLLTKMIYHGKIAVATEALTGYKLESYEVLGYSAEQWAFLEENEANIWEVFVRNQLLFSTDMMVHQRLVEPAPFSKLRTSMDVEIPGRVARYIGYKLVQSYAENHRDLSLQSLIRIRDAQKFLRDAQYKP
jgi:hypothetical protein